MPIVGFCVIKFLRAASSICGSQDSMRSYITFAPFLLPYMYSRIERERDSAISLSETEAMEGLPSDLALKIFCFLDHQDLATAQQVCRKWRVMASNNILWCNLFKERWGEHHAAFYAPLGSKLWKDVYEVQDRCDRVGLGLKIIRECDDYYLVHQGEIQRYLGSRKGDKVVSGRSNLKRGFVGGEESLAAEEPCLGILDKILFFIGDLEVASGNGKRSRVL